MGTDCYLKTSEGVELLDRWYVFDDAFKSRTEYEPVVALAMIKRLRKKFSRRPVKPKFGDGDSMVPYYNYWYRRAASLIKGSRTKIVFYADYDADLFL